jgi:hypothetical protein
MWLINDVGLRTNCKAKRLFSGRQLTPVLRNPTVHSPCHISLPCTTRTQSHDNSLRLSLTLLLQLRLGLPIDPLPLGFPITTLSEFPLSHTTIIFLIMFNDAISYSDILIMFNDAVSYSDIQHVVAT